MKILGIDPGAVSGGCAIVMIDDGAVPQLVDAIDLPTVGVKAKQCIDVLALRTWIQQHRPDRADARLLRAWRAWHAEQLQEALVGLHRDVMERLMAQLKDLRTARELVNAIETMDWSTVDANTRLIALHEINVAICKLRERLGQEPIDDGLWHEPPRAYQLIKQIISQNGR